MKEQVQAEIDRLEQAKIKTFKRFDHWNGSNRLIEQVENEFNQIWPKLVFLRLLLAKEVITQEDLNLANQMDGEKLKTVVI